MKKLFSRFVPLSLFVALMLALVPVPSYAADELSVTPNVVVDNVITVTGATFDETAAVLLNGSALGTNVLNTQTLTATVPEGFGAGTYTVTVSMDQNAPAGSGTLTVLDPTPVPPPTATTAPLPFVRPQFVVKSSRTSGSVSTNEQFKLNVVITNAGTSAAYSVQAVFSSADLVPLKTGGVAAVGTVAAGDQSNIAQQFQVTGQVYGQSLISLDVTVTYYDEAGTSYTDKFTLSLPTTG